MEESDYATTFALEGHNWWFIGTRKICHELATRAGPVGHPKSSGSVSLDVGCGTGFLLSDSDGEPVGIDSSMTALAFCQQRSLKRLVNADGANLPFADGSIECITAIGVIEHIDDDVGAVAEWARVLSPTGQLTLLTSAYTWMWSGHDVSNHHVRRYRRRDVERMLAAVGLEPVQVSYVNTLLFPPIAVVRIVERLLRRGRVPTAHKNTAELPGAFNRVLTGLLGVEAWMMRRVSMPFGVSIVASATKPAQRRSS